MSIYHFSVLSQQTPKNNGFRTPNLKKLQLSKFKEIKTRITKIVIEKEFVIENKKNEKLISTQLEKYKTSKLQKHDVHLYIN